MTSSSVPWMTSTGEVILGTLSMLQQYTHTSSLGALQCNFLPKNTAAAAHRKIFKIVLSGTFEVHHLNR